MVLVTAVQEWWQSWLPLTLVNLACVAGWLLVVPGPPATLALYAAVARVLDGDDVTPREFAAAVGRHFWRGWAWASLTALPLAALVPALFFYARFPDAWARVAEVVAALLVAGWSFVQVYALAFLVVQERPSLRAAYRNAVLTILASPLHAAVLGVALALLLALTVRFMALAFLLTPVLVATIGIHAVRERLARFGIAPAA